MTTARGFQMAKRAKKAKKAKRSGGKKKSTNS
jgi:hypothetical protein